MLGGEHKETGRASGMIVRRAKTPVLTERQTSFDTGCPDWVKRRIEEVRRVLSVGCELVST
jgi:hypothetical protein